MIFLHLFCQAFFFLLFHILNYGILMIGDCSEENRFS